MVVLSYPCCREKQRALNARFVAYIMHFPKLKIGNLHHDRNLLNVNADYVLSCHKYSLKPSLFQYIYLISYKIAKIPSRSPALIDILVKKWSKIPSVFIRCPSITQKKKKGFNHLKRLNPSLFLVCPRLLSSTILKNPAKA